MIFKDASVASKRCGGGDGRRIVQGKIMSEADIGMYVRRSSVEQLLRMRADLDSGAAGAGGDAELLLQLRRDPERLGDFFRLAADMKIAAHVGR